PALSVTVLRSLLEQLPLAIFVFRGERLVYSNPPAARLVTRLRSKYAIEIQVMLLDQLEQARERSQRTEGAITLTGHDNEPFVLTLMNLRGRHGDVAFSIREIGTDMTTVKERYHLSSRESQVAELVLRGHRNSQIAATLGITPATTKKHLSRIFEKVGVDSRSLLVGKLV
ncbi:MAG: response regulator transcription factor, partial [Vicinamibacterales bacterium]